MGAAGNAIRNAAGTTESAAPVFRRVAAFMWDYLFILPYFGLLALAQFVFPQMRKWFLDPSTAHLASFLVITLPVVAYFAVPEASVAKATFGKRIMRIQVVTHNGQRLTAADSVTRTVVKFIPWELGHAAVWRFTFAAGDPSQFRMANIFLAGTWILVAAYAVSMLIDKRRRTLYDFAARSCVVGLVVAGK